jgi:hypothetical protein
LAPDARIAGVAGALVQIVAVQDRPYTDTIPTAVALVGTVTSIQVVAGGCSGFEGAVAGAASAGAWFHGVTVFGPFYDSVTADRISNHFK